MRYLTFTIGIIMLLSVSTVALAERSGSGEYSISSPTQFSLDAELTITGQEASDLRCGIDSEYGDGNGDVESWEVGSFEDDLEADDESDHAMNAVGGKSTNLIVRISKATGNCESTNEVTIRFAGIVVFEGVDTEASSFTIKFYTPDDEYMSSSYVTYNFEGYEVVSASGLSELVNDGSSVEGYRIPGEVMEITFQESEEESILPGFNVVVAATSIFLAAMIQSVKHGTGKIPNNSEIDSDPFPYS
jgi:hypothetical protein